MDDIIGVDTSVRDSELANSSLQGNILDTMQNTTPHGHGKLTKQGDNFS